MQFRSYIEESKNTHMEHLEDLMLNGGVEGTRQAINALQSLRDMLAGHTRGSHSISVKWDGAPAVFAGIDPADGKFFVAKKGLFNKTPVVYKTPADVDADTSGDLAEKLKAALKYLKDVGIKGVVQGDFLFTRSDLKTETIDGEKFLTFHPNTIVYAVPYNSKLARKMRTSEFGIVWHTTYTGDSLPNMQASFGKHIASNLRHNSKVWMADAMFSDVAGNATLTAKETQQVTAILSQAGKIFAGMKRPTIDGISSHPDLLIMVKTYINTHVRRGQRITNVPKFVDGLIAHMTNRFDQERGKRKTERGKLGVTKKQREVMKYFATVKKADLVKLFTLYNLLTDAKHVIVGKLNRAKSMHTFLLTKDGFKVTNPEGFVSIDHIGNAIKIVDRLEFSHSNFNPEIVKGWQR